MTDAQVAKALGWRKREEGDWVHSYWKLPDGTKRKNAGRFTTSLDAITAEIEARGLVYSVQTRRYVKGLKARPSAFVWLDPENAAWRGDASTAPLALCAALLNYLKEPRP